MCACRRVRGPGRHRRSSIYHEAGDRTGVRRREPARARCAMRHKILPARSHRCQASCDGACDPSAQFRQCRLDGAMAPQHHIGEDALRQTAERGAPMTRERLFLFDTTLRDGAQTTGVDFSLDDKRHIAALLDELGIDYIEGGYPGANPLDTEFFAATAEAEACAVRRLRHDQARRALGRQRSGRRRRFSRPKPTRSPSSPRPGTIMSMSRSARRWRKISTASPIDRSRVRARAARRCSIASISSTAIKPIAIMRSPAPRPPRGRRALDRSLRHQWRDAAA